MENKDSTDVLNELLLKLYNKNIKEYKSLSEADKTKYLQTELKKIGIIFSKDSEEILTLLKLKKLTDEMNENITTIHDSIIYSNNQSKLSRLHNNITKIFSTTQALEENIQKFKIYISSIEKIFIKKINKIRQNKGSKKTKTEKSVTEKTKTRKASVRIKS